MTHSLTLSAVAQRPPTVGPDAVVLHELFSDPTVVGPTGDSFEVMYDELMIPEHEVGDRILFLPTGGYCAVSGSNFNALRRPAYKIVE